MTFSELLTARDWRPIHNCPGRYVLTGVPPSLPLETLIGGEVEVHAFDVEAARDTVLVTPLVEGGLISYKRTDGSYLHTLNTAEGFSRKLLQLGIVLD
jgi:hypothetical protein